MRYSTHKILFNASIKPISKYYQEISNASQFNKSCIYTFDELQNMETSNYTVRDLKKVSGNDLIKIVINQNKVLSSYAIHYNLNKWNHLKIIYFL